jgi:hypothetical protein
MYNCYDCGSELLEHEVLTGCATSGRLGGTSDLILLACNHQLDSDEPDAAAINAEIDAGRAIVIRSVKVGMNDPAPEEVDSTTSCGTASLSTYNRSLTIEDFNVTPANCAAWNPLLAGGKLGGIILVECPTEGLDDMFTFINHEIKLRGGRNNPNVNTQLQKFTVTANWRSLEDSCMYIAPTGITGLDA